MRALVTILDNITETSMPFNEFVLYRANHYSDEKQILIICNSRQELPKVVIPKYLEIIYTGKNIILIRKAIKKVIDDCEKQNIQYIIHLHQVQSGLLAEMAMLGTKFRKKVLFTVHSTFSGYKFYNKFFSFMNTIMAQMITCVSNTSYFYYPKLIKIMKDKRMHIIQNGVDSERIDYATLNIKTNYDKKYINCIYIARFIPVKNHIFLISVLEKCDPNVNFTFIGTGNMENAIHKKAEEAGISSRITFTGLIPRDEVFKELRSGDCYISSSTVEGLPVSVLEAMYSGLPCLLSDIPQHREVAGDVATIIPFDVEAWSNKINWFAKLSREQRLYLSRRSKNYVAKHFTLSKMHEKYDILYDLLMQMED